jgi:streptogramin lyase
VVFRIDPAIAEVSATAELPFAEAADIEAGEGAVWVTMFQPNLGNVLVRLNPRTLRTTKTITAPESYGSSLNSTLAVDDGAVWWNGADAGTIWRVDSKTGEIVSSIRLTAPYEDVSDFEPLGIAAGAGGVWVTVSITP